MRIPVKKLVLTSFFIALSLVLPQLAHLVYSAGNVLLPMHLPVLLCGMVCGWPYGAVCGLVAPFLSSLFTGMPPLYPVGTAMALELCAYGAVSGVLYRKLGWNVYLALVAAMLAGRVVLGAANALFYGMSGAEYGLMAFLSGAFLKALPGIVLQLVLVPLIVTALVKAGLVPRTDKPLADAGGGES